MFWSKFTRAEKGTNSDFFQDSELNVGDAESEKKAQSKPSRKARKDLYLEILKKIGLEVAYKQYTSSAHDKYSPKVGQFWIEHKYDPWGIHRAMEIIEIKQGWALCNRFRGEWLNEYVDTCSWTVEYLVSIAKLFLYPQPRQVWKKLHADLFAGEKLVICKVLNVAEDRVQYFNRDFEIYNSQSIKEFINNAELLAEYEVCIDGED